MASEDRVGDFVSLVRGRTYKGALVGSPGPALLGLGSIVPGGGFRNDFKTYGGDCPPELMLFPGDLFVSLKGATKDGEMIGSIARLPESVQRGRITQDTVKLVFRERNYLFETYLYWVLRTPEYRSYCAGRATGSAVVALSRSDFLSYPVPPLTSLRARTVEVLESIERKIESNQRAANHLQSLAKLIFRRWRDRVDCLRPSSFGEFADVRGGATPKTGVHEYWGGRLAWATPTDVTRLSAPYLGSTSRTITEAGLASCTAVLHPIGTILMTSRATIGAFAINQVPSATNQGFIAVRPRSEVDRWFLFEEMRSRVPEFLDNANGSTFLEISRGRFKELPLDVPSEDEIASLAGELSPLHQRAASLTREVDRLLSLRDSMLSVLMTEDIRVPEEVSV